MFAYNINFLGKSEKNIIMSSNMTCKILITNARIRVHLELTRGTALTAVTGKQWGASYEFLENKKMAVKKVESNILGSFILSSPVQQLVSITALTSCSLNMIHMTQGRPLLGISWGNLFFQICFYYNTLNFLPNPLNGQPRAA